MKLDSFTKDKLEQTKTLFAKFYQKEPLIFLEDRQGFRSRANFAMYLDDNGINYSMFIDGKKTIIKEADFVEDKIKSSMQKLIDLLNGKFKDLSHKLFETRFATTSHSDKITLLYHKDLNTINDRLELLQKELEGIDLVALSRKQKKVFKDDFLRHKIKNYNYEFSDECFIQPNLSMNENMLEFVKTNIKDTKDLLELYCGYGNFSIYLSDCFNKILATELSKKAIYFAKKNLLLNDIKNIFFAKLNDKEIKSAILKEREFNRLKDINLDDFNFSHILVDPPRCGLGECVDFVGGFENIIYISCNPQTALRDLEYLCKTHTLEKLAFFDQFKNTPHLECGMILKIKKD